MTDPDSPPSKMTRFDVQHNEQQEVEADPAGNDKPTTTTATTKIYDLNADILGLCHSLLGVGHYRYAAMACKMLHKGNLAVNDNKKITSMEVVTSSISCAQQFFEDEATDSKQLELFWYTAVRYNRIEVMIWAHHQGYASVWKETDWASSVLVKNNLCSRATKYGHLSCLKWLRENGCDWDADTCSNASKGGHLSCLKWLRENGCPWDASTCSDAAGNGHLSCLKWARENGCPWNDRTCSVVAAKGGHLSCLIWARENGCDWDAYTCSVAAGSGHLSCLKWARENGCPWNANTCSDASLYGHLSCLKWARENGCPWNDRTCSSAALNGHLSCLKWARENGCDWNKLTYISAQFSPNIDVMNYVIDQGCPRR